MKTISSASFSTPPASAGNRWRSSSIPATLAGVIDITTTEVCDLLLGGVLPATEDRFGAIARTRMPYIGSCGALDMVNFGPMETVPERYRGRTLHVHNPTVTLMRTTPEENARIGRWIGERLNLMDGPVRFFLPEGGVSALDAPGRTVLGSPTPTKNLFRALEATVRQTASRRLIRVPAHINDPQFSGGNRRRIPPLVRRAARPPARKEIAHAPCSALRDPRPLPRHESARRADHRRRRRHRHLRQGARSRAAPISSSSTIRAAIAWPGEGRLRA